MKLVTLLNGLVFSGLLALAFSRWRRHGGDAGRWVVLTFATLAGVSLLALPVPNHPNQAWHWWVAVTYIKLLLAILLLYPYCLYRFMAAFKAQRPRSDRIAAGLTIAVVASTFALPYFPASTDRRPWWLLVYVWLIVVQWASLSVVVTVRLWQAGRGQPSVARKRMRVLSIGSLVFAIAILPSAGPPAGQRPAAVNAVLSLLPLFAATLFFLGFSPPAWLRLLWRQREDSGFQDVQKALMVAVNVEEVAGALLPQIAGMCGGAGAVILDNRGEPVASHAMNVEQQRAVAAAVMATASPVRMVEVGPRLLALPLQSGWLAVELSVYTPLFGEEEVRLMEALGVFADLALQRIDLFERERLAREEAERANTEMETLVYGVSHDLKSPIISLLGYIEYLKIDYGDVITGEGQRYIERMTASALYMQDLIQDLLELSRIGRVQTESEAVDLNALIDDIASQVAVTHPALTINVESVPVVEMNPVRARQLFTNLIENAARHGGRTDLTVRVTGEQTPTETTITVADDGAGIPEPYREKVFGVFERLAGPTDTGGTGMGLAVCRKIVDQLGGSIGAVEAPVGASIRMTFPRSRLFATPHPIRSLETTAQ